MLKSKKMEDIKIEEWVAWLQVRIPELKKSHNAFWVKEALNSYHKDMMKSFRDNVDAEWYDYNNGESFV